MPMEGPGGHHAKMAEAFQTEGTDGKRHGHRKVRPSVGEGWRRRK